MEDQKGVKGPGMRLFRSEPQSRLRLETLLRRRQKASVEADVSLKGRESRTLSSLATVRANTGAHLPKHLSPDATLVHGADAAARGQGPAYGAEAAGRHSPDLNAAHRPPAASTARPQTSACVSHIDGAEALLSYRGGGRSPPPMTPVSPSPEPHLQEPRFCAGLAHG